MDSYDPASPAELWDRLIGEAVIPVERRVFCPSALEEWDERRARRRARRDLASVRRLACVRRPEISMAREVA